MLVVQNAQYQIITNSFNIYKDKALDEPSPPTP